MGVPAHNRHRWWCMHRSLFKSILVLEIGSGQLSRRALLIALGGAATVAVGVGAVVYVNNATSTPEKTISNYLDAITEKRWESCL